MVYTLINYFVNVKNYFQAGYTQDALLYTPPDKASKLAAALRSAHVHNSIHNILLFI